MPLPARAGLSSCWLTQTKRTVSHSWDRTYGKSGGKFPFSILSAMLSLSFQLKYALWVQGKDFHVSQFITCVGAGDIKTEVISLYWGNQCFVGMCLPVPTSHSSTRLWEGTPEGPWVCVQLKSFVHRAEESPLLLKQTNKKAAKTPQQNKGREKDLNA